MVFKLPDSSPDIAATLRDYEMQTNLKLPIGVRQAMIAAADRLDDQRKLLEDVSSELSAASNLRVGMMDSQSRADEVARHIKNLMTSLDQRIRELLAKPHAITRQPKPDSAVI